MKYALATTEQLHDWTTLQGKRFLKSNCKPRRYRESPIIDRFLTQSFGYSHLGERLSHI